jgi:hypothetical protein
MFRLKASELTKAPMRDPPSLGASLARIAIAVGGYALLLVVLMRLLGLKTGLVAGVVLAPLTIPLLVPGILGAIPAYLRWARDHRMDRWQGRYYTFEDRHIRIVEHRGKVWIVLADIVTASKMRVTDDELAGLGRGSVADLEEFDEWALSDTAALELLSRRKYREAGKFKLWLERDVLPPIYRRRTGQRVPDQFGAQSTAGAQDPPSPGT